MCCGSRGVWGTDQERAELENLPLDFCNQEIKGTKKLQAEVFTTRSTACSNIIRFSFRTATFPRSMQIHRPSKEIRRVVEACKLREKTIFSLIFPGNNGRGTVHNPQPRLAGS